MGEMCVVISARVNRHLTMDQDHHRAQTLEEEMQDHDLIKSSDFMPVQFHIILIGEGRSQQL